MCPCLPPKKGVRPHFQARVSTDRSKAWTVVPTRPLARAARPHPATEKGVRPLFGAAALVRISWVGTLGLAGLVSIESARIMKAWRSLFRPLAF